MPNSGSNVCLRRLRLPGALALALLSSSTVAAPVAAGVIARYAASQTLFAPLAAASNRMVSSCADDSSAGTLRAVIGLAGSGDTIDLTGLPGADPACTTSTITLTQGELAIPHNLTLQGPSNTTLTISGSGMYRVLDSTSADAPGGYLQVNSLTISNGKANSGGCISASGAVILDHATVTDCVAYSYGGGKYPMASGGGISAASVSVTNGSRVTFNSASGASLSVHLFGGGIIAGQFTCVDSTISGNITAFGKGGGVVTTGNASITRCTIDSNGAKYAGGILVLSSGALFSIDQSTISGNTGGEGGGGIYSKAPLTISNSTVAFNLAGASYGAGIQSAANITAVSSIFAMNSNTNAVNPDIMLAAGKALGGSNDLVMSINNVPLVGVIVSSADPMLAPLGDHGGLTRTHALLAGSPAIDAGKNTSAFATDQRGAGFAREVPTGKPDIGAYERQPDDDEIFGNGFD